MGKRRPSPAIGRIARQSQPDDAAPISTAASVRWLLGIALAGFVVFWLVLLTRHAGPGWTGMLVHLLVAVGAAFGFMIAAVVVFALVLQAMARPDPVPPTRGQGPLGPVLDELEAVRRLAQKSAFRRALWMAPLGAVVAFPAGRFAAGPLEYDPVLIEAIAVMFGLSVGGIVASLPGTLSYARLYKARVVPMLIGTSNELHYRKPPKAQLQALQALFRFDALRGEDALVGRYRGLAVTIAELRALRRRLLRPSKAVFDGLVVEVVLLNRLSGDTIILPAAMRAPHQLGSHRLEPVHLEDRGFTSAYSVYSNDQLMARALLTPDFMERFRALDRRGRFGQPLCLGHANQLFVALPTLVGHAIFSPPDFDLPASEPDVLTQLREDFAAVLTVIDAVIDLDSRTRIVAAAVPGEPASPGDGPRLSN